MTSGQPTSPAGTALQMLPLTITNLILIAIAVVVTIVMIWWGTRLWRERRDTVETMEDRGDIARVDTAAGPAASEPARLDPVTPEPIPVVAPTAPSPPPIADTPVIATAPDGIIAPAIEPGAGDDLTILKGIGPKVAAELARRDITSFAALAALTPEQAQAIDAELGNFRGRMFRDRWIDQARYLAAGDRAGFEAEFGKL